VAREVSIARQDDGTAQLTFVLPWAQIDSEREEVIKELAADVEVPGFRRGKAPIEKARAKLDQQKLIEHTLSHILPKLFAEAIKTNKIVPAIYPKFELLVAREGEDWQVRATTAELPEVNVSNYEKQIKSAKSKLKKEATREEKENIAIRALQDNYKFTVPKLLSDEEVNSRLSSLLERLEKLGLSLESYLVSIKKTVEDLRSEYAISAENAIRLDVVLGRIAEKEKITVSEEEINEFTKVANSANPTQKVSSEQKNTISAFLIKRKVLDRLVSLVS